jgi:transketolase
MRRCAPSSHGSGRAATRPRRSSPTRSRGGASRSWSIHAGAPGDEPFALAREELVGRIEDGFAALGLALPTYAELPPLEDSRGLEAEPESGAGARKPRVTDEYVVDAYGEELVELAARHEQLVVLDADLASDCRVRGFELAYPDRFLECGIAEQDMVSTAAGLARHGFLPVVNSFASFLASRANEQIYNQSSEGTKVVYALHYAGLIPAGPGKSHQSIRDVSLLAALPGMTIAQPGNAEETRALVRWAIDEAEGTVAIRLAIGPSPRHLEFDGGLEPGRGRVLRDGSDAVLFAYGPVMLHEALSASELLAEDGFALAVVNMPWLNVVDAAWLADAVDSISHVVVLEDHSPVGALGDTLRRALDGRPVTVYGVEGTSLAERIASATRVRIP